jgi:hypothetical protein
MREEVARNHCHCYECKRIAAYAEEVAAEFAKVQHEAEARGLKRAIKECETIIKVAKVIRNNQAAFGAECCIASIRALIPSEQPAPLCPKCGIAMDDGNGCHMVAQPVPEDKRGGK